LAALAAQSRRAREAGATSAAEGMDQAIAAVTLVVEGELARARVQRLGGVRGTTANVLEVVDRLVTVLEHTDKGEALAFDVAVPDGLGLAVGEEHLAEMLGALMENAVRHALRQVRITATAGPGWTRLTVEDDGPGMLPS